MEMGTGFDMDCNVIRPGRHKLRNELIRIRDHQVHVERNLRHFLDRLDYRRADRKVRHEMSVHHIDMEQVGTGSFDSRNFVGQAHEIRGEDGRGNQRGMTHNDSLTLRNRTA